MRKARLQVTASVFALLKLPIICVVVLLPMTRIDAKIPPNPITTNYTFDQNYEGLLVISNTTNNMITVNLNGFKIQNNYGPAIFIAKSKNITIDGRNKTTGACSDVVAATQGILLWAGNMFDSTSQNIIIKNLHAVGAQRGIELHGTNNCTIDVCDMYGGTYDGLYADKCITLNVQNCNGWYSGMYGFLLDNCITVKVRNSNALNNKMCGFNMCKVGGLSVENCLASNNMEHGYLFWWGTCGSFVNCKSENNGMFGYYNCVRDPIDETKHNHMAFCPYPVALNFSAKNNAHGSYHEINGLNNYTCNWCACH